MSEVAGVVRVPWRLKKLYVRYFAPRNWVVVSEDEEEPEAKRVMEVRQEDLYYMDGKRFGVDWFPLLGRWPDEGTRGAVIHSSLDNWLMKSPPKHDACIIHPRKVELPLELRFEFSELNLEVQDFIFEEANFRDFALDSKVIILYHGTQTLGPMFGSAVTLGNPILTDRVPGIQQVVVQNDVMFYEGEFGSGNFLPQLRVMLDGWPLFMMRTFPLRVDFYRLLLEHQVEGTYLIGREIESPVSDT